MTAMTKAAALALLLLITTALGAAPAWAGKGAKYVYVITKVEAAKGIAKAPSAAVRAGLEKALAKSPMITATLPDGAPDPAKEPKKFTRYLKKKKLSAFRVNVEITAYEQSTEVLERGQKRVSVHIALRLFGETIPDRVMAFAGSGSATVKLDVGKRVRPADEKAANADAIEVAAADAVAESLKKLSSPKKKKKKRSKK